MPSDLIRSAMSRTLIGFGLAGLVRRYVRSPKRIVGLFSVGSLWLGPGMIGDKIESSTRYRGIGHHWAARGRAAPFASGYRAGASRSIGFGRSAFASRRRR